MSFKIQNYYGNISSGELEDEKRYRGPLRRFQMSGQSFKFFILHDEAAFYKENWQPPRVKPYSSEGDVYLDQINFFTGSWSGNVKVTSVDRGNPIKLTGPLACERGRDHFPGAKSLEELK